MRKLPDNTMLSAEAMAAELAGISAAIDAFAIAMKSAMRARSQRGVSAGTIRRCFLTSSTICSRTEFNVRMIRGLPSTSAISR